MVDAMVASKTAHVTMANKGKQIGEGDIELTDPGKVAMKVSSGGRTSTSSRSRVSFTSRGFQA
jgi:hypothetical protein